MYITHIHHLIHEYSLSSHIHPQVYTAIIKKKKKKKNYTRPYDLSTLSSISLGKARMPESLSPRGSR